MKEYDRVRLLVEKERYAEEGVHKGMDGWICYDQKCEEPGWFALINTAICRTSPPFPSKRRTWRSSIRRPTGNTGTASSAR